MAFLDSLCKLVAAQQVTADAAGNNTFDKGNITPKSRLGVGEPMGVLVVVTAVGTNTGSSKLEVVTSAAADLGTPTIVGERDIAAGEIVAGARFIIPISQGGLDLRYWGVYFDITGTVDFTVDAYLAPLSMISTTPQSYAKGFTVS